MNVGARTPRRVPVQPRTIGLQDGVSLAELNAMKAIPGAEGVTLAKGSIDRSVFRNLWELSDHHGIEYGLTKELLGDGTTVGVSKAEIQDR